MLISFATLLGWKLLGDKDEFNKDLEVKEDLKIQKDDASVTFVPFKM